MGVHLDGHNHLISDVNKTNRSRDRYGQLFIKPDYGDEYRVETSGDSIGDHRSGYSGKWIIKTGLYYLHTLIIVINFYLTKRYKTSNIFKVC